MGRHKRRIFARTPYVKEEKEKLDITKQYLRKKAPHMNYSDELLLRLCYSGHFLLSEITEKFKMYDEWH